LTLVGGKKEPGAEITSIERTVRRGTGRTLSSSQRPEKKKKGGAGVRNRPCLSKNTFHKDISKKERPQKIELGGVPLGGGKPPAGGGPCRSTSGLRKERFRMIWGMHWSDLLGTDGESVLCFPSGGGGWDRKGYCPIPSGMATQKIHSQNPSREENHPFLLNWGEKNPCTKEPNHSFKGVRL